MSARKYNVKGVSKNETMETEVSNIALRIVGSPANAGIGGRGGGTRGTDRNRGVRDDRAGNYVRGLCPPTK